MPQDHRRQKRSRERIRVRFWNRSLEGRGFTRDVSAGGLYLESNTLVEVDTRLHLEIDLGDPFFAEGVVARRVRPPRQVQVLQKQGFGVRFVTLRDALDDPALHGRAGGSRLTLDLVDPAALARVLERDVRVGVLFVQTDEPHDVGTPLRVRLGLPATEDDDEPQVDVQGVVIARVDAPRGVGLRIEQAEQLQARLAAALEHACAKADPLRGGLAAKR